MDVRTASIAQFSEQLCLRLCAGKAIGDDPRVHLETCDGLPRFRAVVAVDGNAIPEHLERLLKTADRVNVQRRRRCRDYRRRRRTIVGRKQTRLLRLVRIPHVRKMAFTMLVVDHANKSFHEDRVIRRIVMAAARCAQITMRGDAWADATARMANRNLQMMTQVGEYAPRGREQGRLKAATREATHLDADGASIESAGVPGIVGEVDHLRHFTAVFANDVVC